jgi:hypothetical protein
MRKTWTMMLLLPVAGMGCSGGSTDATDYRTREDIAVDMLKLALTPNAGVQTSLAGTLQYVPTADIDPTKGEDLKFRRLVTKLDGTVSDTPLDGPVIDGTMKGFVNDQGNWFAVLCLNGTDCPRDQVWGYKPMGANDPNLPIKDNQNYHVFTNYKYQGLMVALVPQAN